MIKALLGSVMMVGAMALPATAFAKSSSQRNQVVGATPSNSNSIGYRGPNQSYTSISNEFEKGVRQYNKGNLHLAKVAFENVALANRKQSYGQAVSFLGLIAAKRNDHVAAVRYFKASLRSNPNVFGLKAALGLSYVELGERDKANSVLAGMKRKQHRHYIHGSNAAERQSSINVLEQALNANPVS